MPPLDPKLYTVAWIAPLEIEVQAALHVLDKVHSGAFPVGHCNDYVFHAGEIHGHNVVIGSFAAGQPYGTSSATSLASHIRHFFPNLWFGLLVGVAAGLPNFTSSPPRDIRLGDVIVALPDGDNPAIIPYGLGKQKADSGFELLRMGHALPQTKRIVGSAIGKIKAKERDTEAMLDHYKKIAQQAKKFSDPGQDRDVLYLSGDNIPVPRQRRSDTERTRVWYGSIGSGDKLLKSGRDRDEMRDKYNVIGLEMEAAGVLNEIHVGTIRGVCDYGDAKKNKEWQPYAAAMAAAFAKAVLVEIEPMTITQPATISVEADTWIRATAYTSDRLNIERLSGESLPMDQCYINLATVEKPNEKPDCSEKGLDERDTAPQPSPFSLVARLKVETPDKKIQVGLPTIFSPRKGADGQITQPRRILIRGRAGVGKTTLCKKAVYDYLTQGVWSELFDRVLWIPLRRLKGWKQQYNLEELFYNEYFLRHVEGRSLSKALWLTLNANADRSLFILDGLDEVSQIVGRDNDLSRFLKDLLNQPNVIITSRPYGKLPAGLGPLDLELETIGFYPEQIKDYLRKVFPEGADNVDSFLQDHSLIRDLVRIPIQLDALCFTWKNSPSDRTVPETMTTVYQDIEQNLWKKDIVRLEKRNPEGKPLTECDTEYLLPSEIEDFVQEEIYLLEGLAFTGLHHDVIDFDSEHRNAISKHFKPPRTNFSLDKTLARLSFLRTSDPSSNDRNRNYHFLHLTYQEYFAARYFVRCWTSEQQLVYPKLGSTKEKIQIEVEKFLQREKYNGRYDIFWRFVAGLLCDHSEGLLRFFELIENEPRDLLGPAHQRLLMHCFNEVALPNSQYDLNDLHEKMEHSCQQWSIYEYRLFGRMGLCRESEFPDKVLAEMLAEGPGNMRCYILQALQGRSRLSPSILEKVADFLTDGTDLDVRRSAIQALAKHSLSDNILQALVPRLEDTDSNVRSSAIEALAKQSSLSDNILQALVSRLEYTDSFVRRFVIEALAKESSLSNNILQALVLRLEHTDSNVRRSAVEALAKQSSLSDNILQALVSRLEDTYSFVGYSALEALVKQSSLSDNILQVLVSRLEHTYYFVRSSAIEALAKQSSLSDNIFQALVSRLEDTDSDVRRFVIEALGKRSSLSDNILQALVSRLEDSDSDVRHSAVKVLAKQSSLSDNILQALVSRLEDTYSFVRYSALEALVKQSSLSDNILQVLVSRLEHTHSFVRSSAIEALAKQSSLSDNILQALVTRLEDTHSFVRYRAVKGLAMQPSLPDSILQTLVSRLEDTDSDIRCSAIKALAKQSSLSDNILQALVTRLEDSDSIVRCSAVEALAKQSSLSDKALVSRLEDTDSFVRHFLVETLRKQSSLSDNILQALVPRLEDTFSNVRRFAFEALAKQSSLSDGILLALVSRLEDTDSDGRRFAIEALAKQPSLPDSILQTLVSRLEDTDSDVRHSAVKALAKQSSLSDNILQALVLRLEHTDLNVRRSAIKALAGQSSLSDNILQALVTRLEDTYSFERYCAVEALAKQSSLSDNILQALVSRLEDSYSDIRRSAVEALAKQSSLSDNILQALVTRLEDTHSDVRRSAVKALAKQSSSSDNILQALVSRLEDADSNVRRSAGQALDTDRFYSILPTLNTHTLHILYRGWIQRSIIEHFSCYIQDENLYIETPNRRREITLLHKKDDLRKAFLTKATAMGIPGS